MKTAQSQIGYKQLIQTHCTFNEGYLMDFQTWITFYSNSVVNLNTFLF